MGNQYKGEHSPQMKFPERILSSGKIVGDPSNWNNKWSALNNEEEGNSQVVLGNEGDKSNGEASVIGCQEIQHQKQIDADPEKIQSDSNEEKRDNAGNKYKEQHKTSPIEHIRRSDKEQEIEQGKPVEPEIENNQEIQWGDRLEEVEDQEDEAIDKTQMMTNNAYIGVEETSEESYKGKEKQHINKNKEEEGRTS
ncbi:hypothetical protein K7X08_000829 [Anisodus acutangulus]|uniref:Uncharacterized protein n=1 Tax=Anisodus acutangulus TaxID=402998 RepID=A0A9Q1MT67_9SOLA|nr:hypothetical protein K7X08_000829 [Anisodus acutangulus]